MQSAVEKIGKLHVQGNVLDSGWFQHLTLTNGKANLNAIIILSEIIYWYKPSEIRDEITGELIGYKKKFKADKLQKSYQSLADQFGLTKTQVKSACKFLRDKGLITIEFRTVQIERGINLANVMFIEPIAEKIEEISGVCYKEEKENKEEGIKSTVGENLTLCNYNKPPRGNNSHKPTTSSNEGMNIETHTYTETTTKTTTEINKKKYSEVAIKIIQYLNEKVGTKYKHFTKNTKTVIESRLNEGFELNDFIKVIDIKAIEWIGTDFEKYLRPSTLFGSKFESYLNQKNGKAKGNKINYINAKDSFSNRKQRAYDLPKLERQLLGWES